MKHIILMALFLAPVSYAADYRQEIMDNVILPCAEWSVENIAGPMPPDERTYVAKRMLSDKRHAVNQEIEVMSFTLMSLDESENTFEQRKGLYDTALNDCIGG